jgi:hypothetical protein
MNEWIIAPLLEPDPTGLVSHAPGGKRGQGADSEPREQGADERRHGDRRSGHDDDDDADPDFGRGEDRRDDVL